MKAFLVLAVITLPLLLTSCYTDGVGYVGGGYHDGRGYHDRGWDNHHGRDVVIDRRPVYVAPRGRDWGYKNNHPNIVVRKDVKYVNKYEKHDKYDGKKYKKGNYPYNH